MLSLSVQTEFLLRQLREGAADAPWEQAAAFVSRAAAEMKRDSSSVDSARDAASKRVVDEVCLLLRYAGANRSSSASDCVPRPAVLGEIASALASYFEALLRRSESDFNNKNSSPSSTLSSSAPAMLDMMAGRVTRALRTPEDCLATPAPDVVGGIKLALAMGRLRHGSVAVGPLLSALCRTVAIRGSATDDGGSDLPTLCALLEAHVLQGFQPSPTSLYALVPVLQAALQRCSEERWYTAEEEMGSDASSPSVLERLVSVLEAFPDPAAHRLRCLLPDNDGLDRTAD